MIRLSTLLAAATGLALATQAASGTDAKTAQAAHSAYLAAINSNDLNRFLETVTDDVVFIAPGFPAMEGQSEVTPWVKGYFDTFQTTWSKQTEEFVVTADWAFERYRFTATDVPHGAGSAQFSTGQGINIYRREDNGSWRVARDIWSNTNTRALNASASVAPDCPHLAVPC